MTELEDMVFSPLAPRRRKSWFIKACRVTVLTSPLTWCCYILITRKPTQELMALWNASLRNPNIKDQLPCSKREGFCRRDQTEVVADTISLHGKEKEKSRLEAAEALQYRRSGRVSLCL
jgi:hypothetical protein